MHGLKKTVAIAVMMALSSSVLAFGTGNMPNMPSGWKLKESYGNVRIYQKGTEQTYLQAIDIQNGGKANLVGTITGYQNFNGKQEPLLLKKTLQEHWNSGYPGRLAITNGQFFNPNANPSMLSFGIKSNWQVLTNGADNGSASKRTLQIMYDGVSTTSYQYNFASSSAHSAIVGLDPAVSHINDRFTVGRTMLCAVNRPYIAPPGYPEPVKKEWLFILTAKNKWKNTTLSDLNSWGCRTNNIVMGDGGGSSQLRTNGGIQMFGHASDNGGFFPDNRLLPSIIVTTNW